MTVQERRRAVCDAHALIETATEALQDAADKLVEPEGVVEGQEHTYQAALTQVRRLEALTSLLAAAEVQVSLNTEERVRGMLPSDQQLAEWLGECW